MPVEGHWLQVFAPPLMWFSLWLEVLLVALAIELDFC